MTAQIHEKLILNGKETSIAGEPPLPDPADDPRIVSTEAGALDGPPILSSTACWRGYQGHWEIKHKRLYLNAIVGRFRLAGAGPIFADWVSGAFRVPEGALAAYVHMGFESRYERERVLTIKEGVVVDERIVEFKP